MLVLQFLTQFYKVVFLSPVNFAAMAAACLTGKSSSKNSENPFLPLTHFIATFLE